MMIEETSDFKANVYYYIINYIRKFYLDPIHLADPGFTQSNLIYSGVLLIYFQVS